MNAKLRETFDEVLDGAGEGERGDFADNLPQPEILTKHLTFSIQSMRF